MAQVDVLAPVTDSSVGGWSPNGAASVAATLSDESDSTYSRYSSGPTVAITRMNTHNPPAGMRRHLARVYLRGSVGLVNAALRLSNGTLLAPSSSSFPSPWTDSVGPAGFGLPPTGPVSFYSWMDAQTPGVDVSRLRVEIDNRLAPTFVADVRNGAGTSVTTVNDTLTPRASFSELDLDGLQGRQYRAWVTDSNSQTVFDSGVVSGSPSDIPVGPLENGTYTLHMQAWSTLGFNTPYPSEVETIEFTMSNTPLPTPTGFVVSHNPEEPFFVLNGNLNTPPGATNPRLEVRRTDCNGVQTTGPVYFDESTGYIDWTVPRSEDGDCLFTYEIRSRATVGGNLALSPWTGVQGSYGLPWAPGEHLVRTLLDDGPAFASVCGEANWAVARPFSVGNPVNGGQVVQSDTVGGHDISLSGSVDSQCDVKHLETVLGQALVLVSPSDSEEAWQAPITVSVSVEKVGRIRGVNAQFKATGPEPVI